MGGIAFAGPLALGAALLAVWLDYRLAPRRPGSATRRFVHAGIAFALLQVTSGVVGHISPERPAGQRLVALFFLLLPSLVYAFLASVWLVRTLVEATHLAGR